MNPAQPQHVKEITRVFRRKFLQLATIASVGGVAFEALATGASKTVTYRVSGFSCITCATGLDTMLGQQRGVTSSKSTYPEGKVTVRFDPSRTTEAAIIKFIADLGFRVEG
jgi:Cu+-exporting ATPase